MPTPTTTITDSKFNALKAKLRELFELDKSDLDFGIYRIIAAKNKEVTEFLDRQLKDVVRGTLAAHGAGAADQVQAELDKAIEQARALGADPETLPKVKDLRARLESSGGAASADLEADIYNHLLAFFGRYYDEGDFISQRRYKGDTYAIPYSGEEVTLHWANKDQYYIKSGEWHKDYRFKVGDKTVRFKLVEATQEVGNNKEADDAKRRYILAAEDAVEETPSELALRFEFRVPKPTDTERAESGVVAIFGGDYAKATSPKRGDERDRFCADAEKSALAAISAEWKAVVSIPSGTEDKPARSILGKHLDDFTARNTFDYFIHKDLGGFLGRELDFYIKNEVVRLDDLATLPSDHLQRLQGKVKAIRAVASRIIAFVGSLEDFQKRMWLKRKFVLQANWMVTVDRIPARLRDTVAASVAQWDEWERLGFKPEATGSPELFGGAEWRTRAYLDACDKLIVDTRHFDDAFRTDLLASEEVLGDAGSVQEATTGTLINGENLQASMLLRGSLSQGVQCIYADPPYNTDAGPIAYKNGYRDSSWLAMMCDRLAACARLADQSAIFCITIDDVEGHVLRSLCEAVLPSYALLGQVPIKNNPAGRTGTVGFSICHEYAIFLGRPGLSRVGRMEHSEAQIARYKERDELGPFEWTNFRKHGGQNTYRRTRPRQFYPIYVKDDQIRIPRLLWNKDKRDYDVLDAPTPGEEVVLPIDDKKRERIWDFVVDTARKSIPHLKVRKDSNGETAIYRKWRLNEEGILPKTWWDKSEYSAAEYGTNLLTRLFGETHRFSFPKSVHAVADCLRVANLKDDPSGCVFDPFGGSGTTAHAVIDLNRADGGQRTFTLVEMGEYFHTVLKPRVAKIVYGTEWANGRAQAHDKGVSTLVRYFAIESYEDALNNLPAPSGQLLDGRSLAEKDALVTYALDLELGPRLLDFDAFRDPWGYTIKAQLAGDAEIKRHRVDLVETFNYLIGLKVHAYGPLERYSADFERAAHADNLGRIKITGRLRRDPNGPFVFQRVEGELNDGNATRVLVVWRKLTDDPEKDAAALDAWMARHRETTRERTEHRDYHLIYINGPVTLPQPTAEIRTVFPTEETFKIKMFEDTDSASSTGGANG